jgi:uncharacterized membrane protein SirB2
MGQVAGGKTLPHLVDTVLLLSALTLAGCCVSRRATRPGCWRRSSAWCLRRARRRRPAPGRPLAVRAAAWLGALATVGWIVSVAITKSPRGFFSMLL